MVSTKSQGWLVSLLIPRPRDRRFESYLWSVKLFIFSNLPGNTRTEKADFS